MFRIMVVDDEPHIVDALDRVLTCHRGCADDPLKVVVEGYSCPLTALRRAEELPAFDMAIADFRMPGMDGVSFLKVFRNIQPGAVRLILGGQMDFDALAKTINEAEIFRFIRKPWDSDKLQEIVGLGMLYQISRVEGRHLIDQVRQFAIGESA